MFSKTVNDQPDKWRWLALSFMVLASFMELLDVTIVNIAIPTMEHSLHASYTTIQWVVTAYGLAFALLLITGGRLGDIFGRKRLLLLGTAGFTIASLLSGISQTGHELIAARVLQGIMAALMVPQALSIVHVTFPKRERAAVFGIFGGVSGLAALAGPILGAVLIDWNPFGWDWRPIFLVNIPVGIITIIGTLVFVRESKSEHPLKIDLPGVALVTLTLLALVYPLLQGRELGWPVWTFISMAASLPLAAIFILYERSKTRKGGSPLLALGLFKRRSFVGGLLVSLLFNIALIAFFFIFTLYLQIGLGYSVLHAGLTSLSWTLATGIAAGMSAGKLAQKLGRKLLHIGALLMAAGMILLMVTVQHYGIGVTSWQFIPGFVLAGLGMGFILPPLFNFALVEVPHNDAGSGTGILETTQQLAGSIGIALIGIVFFGWLGSQAIPSVNQTQPQINAAMRAAHIPASAQAAIAAQFRACFSDRAHEQNASVIPKSCQQSGSKPQTRQGIALQSSLQAAAVKANALDFSTTFKRSLAFEAAAYLLTFLFVFLLPKHPGRR